MKLPDVNEFRPAARLGKRQTEADVPDKNPFDTAPQSEFEYWHEKKVRAALAGMSGALKKHRPFITIEQLMEMTHVHPELEGELPEIDGIRHGMFMFSVSGKWQGRSVTRALLGGDVILVSAESPHAARKQALQGLQDTLAAAQEYANAAAWGVDLSSQENLGVSLDAEAPTRQ